MAAEIIGIDKIVRYCERYDFQKIKLSKGTETIYLARVKDGQNQADLIADFQDWAAEFIDESNFKEYKLELFGSYSDKPDARLQPVIKIAVAFNPKPDHFIGSAGSRPSPISQGIDVNAFVSMAQEKAALEARCEALEQRLNDLEDEIDADEAEDINGIEQEITPQQAITRALIGKADLIIDALIGRLMPQPVPAINGTLSVGNEEGRARALEILNEFEAINPDIVSDLDRLLKLAKSNRPLFDMLINQLRAL